VVEEDVYVGAEGDVEGVVGEDEELVSDELLDVDDAGAEDYVDIDTAGDEAPDENGGHDVAEKDGEAEEEARGDSREKVSRKRSRSHSKSPPEKDDFDDDELDSDVDETGGVLTLC